ncbi:DUF4384 domain-containing protein [uncultured Cohaesibacter sp.]|uniref:DUF4384 domain-containing protein n=1 Tax=uncultured Cohaesibacter sp. TaxID=1002546 RepID=UPI0029C656C8|nr:DUF4384 domain-containing protein [uncultured Cohaesibacter sp.]
MALASVSGALAEGSDVGLSFTEASEIINQALDKKVTCWLGKSYTVAFHSFKPEKSPLTPRVANLLHQQLLASLTQKAPGCIDYISVVGAGELLTRMNDINALQDKGVERVTAIESSLKDADFTLVSNLYELGQTYYVELSLSDQKLGKTLVSSGAIAVPERFKSSTCGDGAMSFEAAVKDIARNFRLRFSDVTILVPEGVSFRNSDALTDFSLYLGEALKQTLEEAYFNRVAGTGLMIKALSDENFDKVRKDRSVTTSPGDADKKRLDIMDLDKAKIFHLSGHYWPCDGDRRTVNLSVTMKNWQNESATWKQFVHLDRLPPSIRLTPQSGRIDALSRNDEWDAPSQFSFKLSSNRGSKPSFSPGEELFLTVLTEQDAWLYCFYTDSEGGMVQFLPNQTQDQHDSKRNFYAKNYLHIVPDEDKSPLPDRYNLKINDDTVGVEAVKCLATSRDVTNELPHDLRGEEFKLIPERTASHIRAIFEALPDTKLAEQSITITVRN